MKCTLCTKELALLFCWECSLDEKTKEPKEKAEFYCKGCNVTMHRTEKRKGHITTPLKKLSLKVAARLVTFAVRYHVGVLNLRKRARSYIRRFFDTKTLCHYYWNSKNGDTVWRKPYCLRKEELFPFLTTETACIRIQGMQRMRRCRLRVIALILKYYRKIFDRTSGRFYYTWAGKSTVVPRQKWERPVSYLLHKSMFDTHTCVHSYSTP